MNQLFPELEPYNTGTLKVSDIHTLYYEECGSPNGKPIVFLHGGPGGGTSPTQRQYFDPKFYRIILFDQRGAGRATPPAELRENTTWDLISDTEKLREHLAIKQWIVFGGSWGSTLALAYSITHPEKVQAIILRGIFLCRKSEIKWFYQEGAGNIFPDEWEKYVAIIPEAERGDLVKAYYKRLTSENEKVRLEAALAWSIWEASTSKLFQDAKLVEQFNDPALALRFARIECHYFTNHAFFSSDSYLLDNIKKIRHLPCIIVQGRYDVVCPITSAWDLHRAWPEAELKIIPDAGHAATEPGIVHELVAATEKFKKFAE